ncbi:hypothetical protein D3C72_1158600 [compost metagenome]
MQEVFRPGSQRKVERQTASGSHSGFDARHGMFETVDRTFFAAGGIFDRTADRSDLCRAQDTFGAISRVVGKTVFQVDGNRQVGGGDNRLNVHQGIVEGQSAIGTPLGKGITGTGSRQRLEAEAGKHFCRTGIPRIGNHKCPGAFVKGFERLGSKGLRIHWAGS